MARIAILEDQLLFAHMLRDVVSAACHEVVFIATNSLTFKDAWQENHHVDLVLLDLVLPGENGLAVAEWIWSTQAIPPKILVVSGEITVGAVVGALRTRVNGFVHKICHPTELLLAIRNVLDGRRFISESVRSIHGRAIDSGFGLAKQLSRAEMRVFPKIAIGLSNSEIGRAENLAESTVQTHRRNIMRKLDVSSTTQLVRLSLEQGLIRQNPDGSLTAVPFG